MAISFDTSFQSTSIAATTWSQSYTVGAGSNGFIMVAINFSLTTGANPVSSITYNGVTMNLFQYKDDNAVQGSMGVYYGYLGTTNGASHTLSVSSGSVTMRYGIIASYLGVSQSGFPDAAGTGSPVLNSSPTTNLAVVTNAVANNCWGFFYVQDSSTTTAGANTVLRQSISTQIYSWLDTNGAQSTGNFTMNATFASSNNSAIFGSMAPAVAATTGKGNFLMFM